MQRRRTVFVLLLLGCGVLALATGAWVVGERRAYQQAVPPHDVTGFDSFVNWRDGIQRFEVLGPASGEYLLATASGGRVVSGPSGYVFDRTGRLVDWSPDIMDDPRFQQKWESLHRRDAWITVEEAQAWLRDHGAGG